MNIRRTIALAVLFLVFAAAGQAGDKGNKGPEITEKIFRQTSSLLVDDPLNESARDWSRLILLYALQSSNTSAALGTEELGWAGVDKGDPRRSLLLLAAYASGNIRSQLSSGVKRNDRYSGLLALFGVYRALQKRDGKFSISAVETLLARHKEAKLMPYLQKLDEDKPAKMTDDDEAVIRRIMRTR